MIRRNKSVFFLVFALSFTQHLDACFGIRDKRKQQEALLKRKADAYEELGALLHKARRTHFEKLPDKNMLIFVDIDGTLLSDNGKPITPVIKFCKDMKALGYTIIILSSREKEGFNETEQELETLGLEKAITELILVPIEHYHTAKKSIGKWKAQQRREVSLRRNLPVAGVLDDRPENLQGDPEYLGYTVLIPEL